MTKPDDSDLQAEMNLQSLTTARILLLSGPDKSEAAKQIHSSQVSCSNEQFCIRTSILGEYLFISHTAPPCFERVLIFTTQYLSFSFLTPNVEKKVTLLYSDGASKDTLLNITKEQFSALKQKVSPIANLSENFFPGRKMTFRSDILKYSLVYEPSQKQNILSYCLRG